MTRAAAVFGLVLSLALAACDKPAVPSNEVSALAQGWSGAARPECSDTDPAGSLDALGGAFFCEWQSPSGPIHGRVSPAAGSTTLQWDRRVTNTISADRFVDSLGKALTARGLTERSCGVSEGTAGRIDSRLWESGRLAVLLTRLDLPAKPPALTVVVADSPKAFDARRCPQQVIAVSDVQRVSIPDTLPTEAPPPRRRESVRSLPALPVQRVEPAVDSTAHGEPADTVVRVDTVRVIDTVFVISLPADTTPVVVGVLPDTVPREIAPMVIYSAPIETEVNTHAGFIAQEILGSRALTPIVGFRIAPLRLGLLTLGFDLNWWLDGINLGPLYAFRTVRMDYIGLAAEATMKTSGPWNTDLLFGFGVGGDRVSFRNRLDAATLFPAMTFSPSANLFLGARVPLTNDGRLMFRIDGRLRGAYAEIFDPTGVRTGREMTLSPELSFGLSYVLRRRALAPP